MVTITNYFVYFPCYLSSNLHTQRFTLFFLSEEATLYCFCRCGYDFCYTCGAEWKNKKATCSCPLWDENNIWDEDDRDFDDEYYSEYEYFMLTKELVSVLH
ncbi:unnamed protein product, partial [Vitis vinifera]|uniref:IBR domain-containing protein n=1 Tax=Vitis vinifera TaxID=29760 RepID=D7TY53_VITVI